MVSNKTIINTFLSVPMGLLLLIVAAGALAAERNTSYKETCKSEVRQHYGTNTEVMVVSERRTNSGLQVKLAARPNQDNTEIFNCWVPSNEIAGRSNEHDLNIFTMRMEPMRMALPPSVPAY